MAQVVAFILYKGFDMAITTVFFASFWLEHFITKTASKALSRSITPKAVVALKAIIMLSFTALTFVYVTGFQLLLIITCMARFIMIFKPSSQTEYSTMRSFLKRSNFDSGVAFVAFVLPATACHVVHFLGFEQYPRWDYFGFQVVYGIVYMVGHITKTAPNLWDNIKLMQCTVPNSYCEQFPDGRVRATRKQFIFSEIGFITDDLFAFATHIPSFYRIAVILLHVCFLIEYSILPPQYNNPQRRRKSRRAAAETIADKDAEEDEVPEDSDDEFVEEAEETAVAEGTNDEQTGASGENKTKRKVTLTIPELRRIAALDRQQVSWLLVPALAVFHRIAKVRKAVENRQSFEKAEIAKGKQPGLQPPISIEMDHLPGVTHEILAHDEVLLVPPPYMPKGHPIPQKRYGRIAEERFQQKMADEVQRWSFSCLRTWLTNIAIGCAVVVVLLLVVGTVQDPNTAFDAKSEPIAPFLQPGHSINNGEAHVELWGIPGALFAAPDSMDAIRTLYSYETRGKPQPQQQQQQQHQQQQGNGQKAKSKKKPKQK